MKTMTNPTPAGRMRAKTLRALPALALLAPLLAARADENLLAFWDFKGGESGTEVAAVENSAGLYTFSGVVNGRKEGGGFKYARPVYSAANVRAEIYTDSTYGELAVADAQSISFDYRAREKKNSCFIDIPDLGTELSKLLAYTIEMFLRYESLDGNRWPQAIAVETAAGSWSLRCGAGEKSSKTELVYGGNGGEGVSPGANAWFHVAVVYEETNAADHIGELRFYYNGTLRKTHAGVVNAPSEISRKVRLGYRLKNGADLSARLRRMWKS